MPAVTQPTQPCAAPQRRPAAAADQDRHAPRLQRPGREPDPRKVEETAGERRIVRRPQLPQHLNRLVGIRTSGRVVGAQRPVLLLERPHPHAERHPPAGEHVERRHPVLGDDVPKLHELGELGGCWRHRPRGSTQVNVVSAW